MESSRATAMLPLPTALGDVTGSAPTIATQTLPATATTRGRQSAGATNGGGDRPSRWRGRRS